MTFSGVKIFFFLIYSAWGRKTAESFAFESSVQTEEFEREMVIYGTTYIFATGEIAINIRVKWFACSGVMASNIVPLFSV